MSTCKFCEAMKTNRQIEHINKSWATEAELEQYGEYMTEYTVAIVKRSWHAKAGKRNSARSVEYRYRGLGFKLNFCPECGADMREQKLQYADKETAQNGLMSAT